MYILGILVHIIAHILVLFSAINPSLTITNFNIFHVRFPITKIILETKCLQNISS